MLTPTTFRRPQWPFHLLLCSLFFSLSFGLMGQDVDFIMVLKEQHYEQSAEHIVSLLDEDWDEDNVFQAPFLSEITVDTVTDQVTGAIVTPPSGPVIFLPLNEDGDGFEADSGYEVLADMNAKVPNGAYAFQIYAVNDGVKNVSVNLTGDNYMALTKFTGFAAAKSINSSSAKTFNWNAISNGLASDWVFFEIVDDNGNTVFESADPGEPGALTGLSTSSTVPAGVLNPGTTYKAFLFLIRPVDTNEDYAAGVTAVAAYGKSIEMEIRTTGNSNDNDDPWLDEASPFWDESDVNLNSIVTFVFNEAMDTTVDASQAISWTGVADPDDFQYSWSPDGHRLFCRYSPGLPASTTIGWALNFSGSSAKLRDVAGNELNWSDSGEFTTKDTSNLGAPDVERIEFFKGRFYEQNGAGSTNLIDYFVDFHVLLSGTSTVSSIDLLTPGSGSSTHIGEFEWDHREISGEGLFAEPTDLSLIFPNGIYSLTMHTVHDGDKTVNLNANSSAYPNSPTIQNFTATQAWDSTQPLTLQWNAMTGGTSSDLIVIYIESDNACFFSTPEFGVGALDGTATSVTIPANTLPPGKTLSIEIAFIKVLTNDTTQYVGATTFSGIASVTELEVHTTGDPIEPAVNIVFDGDMPTMTITGEQGIVYEVSSSSDLLNWTTHYDVWLDGEDCEGFHGEGEFYDFDFDSDFDTSRFYRLREIQSDDD